LHKDSFPQKRKASTSVAQIQSDQDEHTTSDLVFKRKIPKKAFLTEHSHSNGRAPHQKVITIQKGEAESLRGKSLWDPDFDVPAHGE